ncbi:MAG TPA: PBP1A family penicillin-binding protein, partial [Terriglobales bacterium]
VGFLLLAALAATVGASLGLLLVYSTDLPQIDQLEHYRPSSITELYDDQGREIGSFALQRRVIVTYDDLPKVLRDAVISIEDKDFESHWGVNLWRIMGAAYRDMSSKSRAQGASTLTMQLSRNLFLSSDRTWGRKIQEIVLALQIERRFTKPQIFTLYANQIFLGRGIYGFEAGAEYYFSKHARDLTLEEAATLAALPKGPSFYSPILYPDRCLRRRNMVINSMLEDGKITADEATRAKAAPLKLNIQPSADPEAAYFVEEVRRYLERKYGTDEVHQAGLRVYTTLNTEYQKAATRAVLDGLAAYERRHGWKNTLEHIDVQQMESYEHSDWSRPIEVGSYLHGLVTQVLPFAVVVKLGRISGTIVPADMSWAGQTDSQPLLHPGDIVYVRVISFMAGAGSGGVIAVRLSLEQESGVQASLLAVDNGTGDIEAMVGGRDFDESKYNRATQAMRQVGSSFKAYVYTAAVEAGARPDDLVLDAPTTFKTPSGPYTPHNYDGKFEGNISLRRAFAESRNIPALKLAEKTGIGSIINYAHRFGVTSKLDPILPLALGSGEITLEEQVAAFTTFPNDGVRVTPRYIRKVVDYDGHVLEENYPEVKDVISQQTARTMTALLQDVVRHGTAAAANLKLDHHPLGGKTGTTNDFTDAWFIGFSPSITCGVWVGFDEKKSLGSPETGGQAALPIWIDFMKKALAGREGEEFPGENKDASSAKVAKAQVKDVPAISGDTEAH